MNAPHTLKEYADALEREGLLTASTLPSALAAQQVDCLSYDTRTLHGVSLFLCKGAHFKEEYLADALAHGAVAYIAETAHPTDAPHLLVTSIRRAMVVLGRLYYNNVIDALTSVGITGTKGKSTTAYYVRSILDDYLTSEGKPHCAMLSSIENYDGTTTEVSHITTPEVLELYRHFQNAHDAGISHLVMEVSSQALKVGRVAGMRFEVGAFLNIGTDHISPIEHADFDDYYHSKLKLFEHCRTVCVNTDADHAAETVAYAQKCGCTLLTFGSHETDELFCERVEKRADGLYFTVRSAAYRGEFSITMPGLFNVSNALAAMAIAQALGVPEQYVRSGLRRARVSGRMQVYESRDKRVTVIVDYAHNRMSFEALHRSARTEYPDKERIGIFGCPGSRAYQRRRDLAEVSSESCSFVYLTEDDPGEESFAQITAQIEPHLTCPHLVCEDRAECIRRAILEHDAPRVILLTGKGEETTMRRAGGYIPIQSDVELTQKYLAEYNEREAKA